MTSFVPYAPLNVPKPFGEGIWIVDGPEIRMDYGPASMPFPTRMTVVRLPGGRLWVHSPIAPDDALFAAIDRLGEVGWLVAPSSIHYWYVADWQVRYPAAQTLAVPGLAEKAKRDFRVDALLDGPAMPLPDDIAGVLVPGTMVSEAVFFHRPSRTVILTDLIENFEPARVRSRLFRSLVRLAGVAHPGGGTPADMRLTFWPRRRAVRAAMAQILAWDCERVVMAHGLPYESGGAAELRRAFGWAL
ncbi:DUF4336 domain-containing protein [Sphingopyxis sp. LC363]|uniref:DUF4336 domain-containing protein n=1 Tax=Sphingopyxis sp. LC363 TaxID=1120705 RepID=UPI0005103532|nr:DUF4336 domain-containing protein [Sphingopyxis sp. LC363]KGB52840.1 hypothetical protein FG95_03465 [Sphingopyxis sp. LC363]